MVGSGPPLTRSRLRHALGRLRPAGTDRLPSCALSSPHRRPGGNVTGFGKRDGIGPVGARWSLVVPVKHLDLAKSRLARVTGQHRAELALAVARDTVAAARACPEVAAVFAVTEDARAGTALAELGAAVISGEPGDGLNPALEHGTAVARRRLPGYGICALSADLPALRPDELALVLAAASGHGRSFLPDTPGVGTTLLAATAGHPLTPAFEGASRARHLATGATELALTGVASVRRDVDTPEDLCAAVQLGVGPHTGRVLERLGRDPAGSAAPGKQSAQAPVGNLGGHDASAFDGGATSCPR